MDSRFQTRLDEVQFFDSHGEKISEENFMNDSSFPGELNVGDVIKRRGRDVFYKISSLHYSIPGVGYFDYAGVMVDEDGKILSTKTYFFNQKDVEYKVNGLRR